MKRLLSILLTLGALAFAAGCANKEMIVTEPAAGLGSEQTSGTLPPTDVRSDSDTLPEIAGADQTRGITTGVTQSNPLETVYFDYDSWILTGHARDALARNAAWLRNNPGISVKLEGHTDERGSDSYNLALGEGRSKSALKYLVILGIDPARMDFISYGEEKPAVEGDDETVWSKNRRVEFITQN
ncbi:MAG: peptidoglycan-associated lipoprotein [Geobacteraceae bacterium GWB2_52_12]|nr:MAG: peptidoglycan-associated lipoprotein [Geobacteraceae bacterium GWB2_52_12]